MALAKATIEIPPSTLEIESGLSRVTRELAAKVDAGEIKTMSMETVLTTWVRDNRKERFALSGYIALKPDAVLQLEQSNRWWITGESTIYLRLANFGKRPVNGVLFSIADTPCRAPSTKKRYFLFQFMQPLMPGSENVYLGSIQMDYHSNFGTGIKCGIVEDAFTVRRK